jgi:hypothetical protein
MLHWVSGLQLLALQQRHQQQLQRQHAKAARKKAPATPKDKVGAAAGRVLCARLRAAAAGDGRRASRHISLCTLAHSAPHHSAPHHARPRRLLRWRCSCRSGRRSCTRCRSKTWRCTPRRAPWSSWSSRQVRVRAVRAPCVCVCV